MCKKKFDVQDSVTQNTAVDQLTAAQMGKEKCCKKEQKFIVAFRNRYVVRILLFF